jgi:succinoglycan biosynthesis transport protein ExoP
MKRAKLRGINDYLAMVVRRRWWVAAAFFVFAGAASLVATLFPSVYRSETMILIQPRDVSTDFVKDLLAGSTDERLRSIEQTILSRTNLLKILSEFESRMPAYRGLNDDRKVDKLKRQILIDFPSQRLNGERLPTTNLTISYKDQNPDLAQQVTNKLGSLFIGQDSKAREDQVYGTTEFLSNELKKVAEELKQSEDQLRTIREKFRNELPSELETNLRTLDRLQLQKTSNMEALDRHLSLQMILERQISETPPMLVRESNARRGLTGAAPVNPKVTQYRQKEQELKDLMVKATPKYPDVQQLKDELAQLKKDIPPEELAASEPAQLSQADQVAVPNPVYQSLTAQKRQLETEIDIREKEKKSIEAEMARYTKLVQDTPGVEQEIGAIIRTNAGLTKQNEDLKNKLDQARLGESLESHQKGSQFVLIDPANYPLDPITPPRRTLVLEGWGISLVAAILVVWVVELMNQRVWTHRELERLLGAPVLIEIPSLVLASDIVRARRKKLVYGMVFVVSAGAYMGGLYYLYLKQSALLRLLDPIIQKVVERITA